MTIQELLKLHAASLTTPQAGDKAYCVYWGFVWEGTLKEDNWERVSLLEFDHLPEGCSSKPHKENVIYIDAEPKRFDEEKGMWEMEAHAD